MNSNESTPANDGATAYGSETWCLDHLTNIGHALTETATRRPDQIAVACPSSRRPTRVKVRPGQTLNYDTIGFAELEKHANLIAAELQFSGVQPGMRVALMIPPSIDFVAHVFALYKTGAVSILIDPGMGRQNLVACLAAARPQAMVGIRKAQLARLIYRSRLPECQINVCSEGWFPGCRQTKNLGTVDLKNFVEPNVDRESPASIIFTTGSTGPPKGVLYRHRNFIQQVQQIRDYFEIRPGGVDASGFPLFALFNTAMGVTTVFPAMNATAPAKIYPPNLVDVVQRFTATQSFGSPALWNTVSTYCLKHSIDLPSVKKVFTAGAPVPPDVLRSIKSIIATDGDVYTPYGATEALPVACISATVVSNETANKTDAGQGTCVGNRFSGIRWRVIQISDQPISDIKDAVELPAGEIGELIVTGPVVTDRYATRTEANADHKIIDGDSFWHRMGDLGYLDQQQRFWFCGRKSHRVMTESETLFTTPCEAIVNVLPQVFRSALVGAGLPGQQVPVIIVQPMIDHWPTTPEDRRSFVQQVRHQLDQHPKTQSIERILLRRELPVDIRHNSKIFREQLKPWAEQQLADQAD